MTKTRPTEVSADEFLADVTEERRRAAAQAVCALMREVSGVEPVMWGSAIVGFGDRPYTTADGRAHDWFAIGLSPRKAALTLYGLTYDGSNDDLLGRLGAHTVGKGCLYVKRLDDVDRAVLRELIERAWNVHDQPIR
ncbi:MAG: DUF1801 domain-containing protein [Gordonia sp. (in: high G+C Gram-positive bacteria)]|uniref:DUF1801 domain-containing protein n=1 Tax=Gordonia sp. (in: high G+C Gram-positive bacteria) TaxID=84139 RepID=UPI0039E40DC7